MSKADLPDLDLQEHLDNPFTARLGAPPGNSQKLGLVMRRPSFHDNERRLSHHLRRYCVLRLFEFVHPRACQFELIERIGMLIRSGYKSRNPALGQYRAGILDAADRREAEDLEMPSRRGIEPSATGLALVGQPGMGKSITLRLALSAYPEVIVHALPETVFQVPWLLIECPSTGGRKQFCIAFFEALGKRVGQNYRALYGKDRRGADEMSLDVQQLCSVHAVGVIVIDELQHSMASKEGPEPLMNFLVTLTNTIGVPVVLVGTMGATPVIERDFRSARRAAALGQPTWTRLHPGEEWDSLMKDMWQFQWTAKPTPFDGDLSAAMYHECQGIIDILVKLFILVQFRAIAIGEARGGDETLTPALIASVAKDELRVLRPMMRALREGREDLLERFTDLKEFHHGVQAAMSCGSHMTVEHLRRRTEEAHLLEVAHAPRPDDPHAPIRMILAARGLGADVVEDVLAEAVRREPSQDPLALVRVVLDLVEGRLPFRPEPAKARSAEKAAKGGARAGGATVDAPADADAPRSAAGGARGRARTAHAVADAEVDAADLRVIAAEAKRRGDRVHAAFVEAGVSRPVSAAVAA